MSILSEDFQGNDFNGAALSGVHENRWCHSILMGFLPAGSTNAPMISDLKTRKSVLRPGGAQVIALGLAVTEKLLGHHAADAVLAEIRWIGLAETIAIPTRHRFTTATLQWVAKNVPGRRKFGAAAGHLSARLRRSLPKDWHILTSDG